MEVLLHTVVFTCALSAIYLGKPCGEGGQHKEYGQLSGLVLRKLPELANGKEAWSAAVYGVAESDTAKRVSRQELNLGPRQKKHSVLTFRLPGSFQRYLKVRVLS